MDRKTDNQKKTYFHADRAFRVNGVWYYLTREGTTFEPFVSKELALQDSARYVAQIGLASDSVSPNIQSGILSEVEV